MSHQEGSELDRELVGGVPGDQTVEIEVKDALAWEDRLEGDRISVAVCAGAVTLSGNVRSEAEKELAESIAWGVSGVTDVANDLRVANASTRS